MTEHQRPRIVRARLALALTAGLALVAGLMGFSQPDAHAAPQTKNYTAVATTSPALYAGLSGPVTVTVANLASSTQSFGSLQLNFGTLPAGAVTNATAVDESTSKPWTESNPVSSSTLFQFVSGSLPGIAPNDSLVITFDLAAPSAGSLPIGIEVKQSNDFSGHGNDFVNQSTSPLSVTVNADSLSFTQEPPTYVGQWSTSNPVYMCQPVQVSLKAGIQSVPHAGVPVTINYTGANPGLYFNGAAVPSSGVTVATDSSGSATFGGSCSSTQPATTGLGGSIIGTGYQLIASSPATSSVTSSTFSVVCQNTCSTGTLTSLSTGTTASAQANGTGSFVLFGSFKGAALECDTQVTQPGFPADPLIVTVTPVSTGSSAAVVATMTFPKTVVNNLANNGTPLMPVCAGATKSFPGARDYGLGFLPYEYQGLLPDCTSSYLGDRTQFCVVSRHKNPGASETVVIYVGADFASDPSFW